MYITLKMYMWLLLKKTRPGASFQSSKSKPWLFQWLLYSSLPLFIHTLILPGSCYFWVFLITGVIGKKLPSHRKYSSPNLFNLARQNRVSLPFSRKQWSRVDQAQGSCNSSQHYLKAVIKIPLAQLSHLFKKGAALCIKTKTLTI